MVYADIEIVNGADFLNARKVDLDIDEVRKIKVNILVDTGSLMLAINENLQEYLQLPVIRRKKSQLGDGRILELDIVGPIEIRFKGRESTCSALLLPGDAEPLLGRIPLEEMDVVIDPVRQELVVNPDHPDYALIKLKGLREAS